MSTARPSLVWSRSARLAAWVALLLLAACVKLEEERPYVPPPEPEPVVFIDTEFEDGAWSVVGIRVEPDLPVGATWRQVVDAGNGNKHREMNDLVSIPGIVSLSVLHVNTAVVYAPASQGAVSSLHYSEDRSVLGGTAGAVVHAQALLEQNGRIFLASLGDSSTFSHPEWRNASATLRAIDFQQLSGPACGHGQDCPDFSSAGARMRFGYVRSLHPAFGSLLVVRHGIDNWQVTVNRRP
jgi:hypothetical protein